MTSAIERECLKALVTARLYIKQKAPYFCSTIYAFIPQFAPGLGTLGVTKSFVLIIDPEWYVNMSKEVEQGLPALEREEKADAMRAGVLVHEAMHILRGMSRLDALTKSGANPELVNIAFDLPINQDIRKAGWLLPSWAHYPDSYGFPLGLTGEQYYDLLLQNPEQIGKVRKKLSKGNGDSKKGESDDKGKVGAGRCGSCAGNPVNSPLEKSLDKEVGRSQADVERIKKTTLQEIREAAAAGRGFVPNTLVEEFKKEEKPKSVVPWNKQLRDLIMRSAGRIMCGQTDFSMRRPSRRSFTRGVIRPSMIERKPEFVFVEDSSGSMGKQQLLASRAEIVGCCEKLGIHECWFVNADTQLSTPPQRVQIRDILKLPFTGRGGTNFIKPLEQIQQLSPLPNICVYTTDGDGEAPPRPPRGMDVVWCIVPTPYGRRPARWGKLILVSDDQKLRDPYGL